MTMSLWFDPAAAIFEIFYDTKNKILILVYGDGKILFYDKGLY